MTPTRLIRVRDLSFGYTDPHDVLGIIETAVFDVYQTEGIREGTLVVDVGAGIGEFAVMASKRVGVTGRVIAIEPNPEDFKVLTHNLTRNRCTNVSVYNLAITSDDRGHLELCFKGKNFTSPTRRLRSVITESTGLGSEATRFIKMDIEGAEMDVIPDNLDIIRHCDCIAMEFHRGSQRSGVPQIEQLGFAFRQVHRRDYILRTAALLLTHPVQSFRLYRAVKESSAYHGVWKFLSGLDISGSEELLVGVFHRLGG